MDDLAAELGRARFYPLAEPLFTVPTDRRDCFVSAEADAGTVDKPLGDSHRYGVSTRPGPHLAKDVLDVGSDRMRAQEEIAGDVLDGMPPGDLLQNFTLALGQRA